MLSNAGSNGNHEAQQIAAKELRQTFLAEFPNELWGDELILGVSGGSDSVALSHLASTINRESGLRKRICLAHVNHKLRGEESDGDEEFVRKLAEDLECEFHSWQVALPEGNQGEGLESRLRDLRYELLGDLARQRSCRCIALAHHRDDQVETILFRIFRGTSLKGLQGIPVAREIETGISLVRPLINISRQQILDYLTVQGLSYRTDSSNLKDGPTRNWIRNELLPKLEERFGPAVVENILRLANQAIETTDCLDAISAELLASSLIFRDLNSVELKTGPLTKTPMAIVRHMLVGLWEYQTWGLRDMSAAKWEELANLINATGRNCNVIVLPGKISARRTDSGTLQLKKDK